MSSGLRLPGLSIKNFRGIADLSIPQLARVTLISGKNNTGKTSILEGVRLLAEGATPEVIREILQLREENVGGVFNDEESPSAESFLVSPLFHGFPQLSEISKPIVISSCNGALRMQMKVGWFFERSEDDGTTRLIPESTGSSGEHDSIPALVVDTANRTRVHPIEQLDRITVRRRTISRSDPPRVSSRFVGSSGTERTETLGTLWDNISLTEKEQYVVEALQIIDPKISAVSMIGETSARRARTAVVRSDNFARRVPLRSFGDGMNRLFGIILSLVNVNGGILLIDEFENGMHYTVQVYAWQMIFRLAQKLDVQILATTHSWDCITSFAQAATELEGTDRIMVRLDRVGERLRVVEYSEENLRVAARQGIEVR